MGNVFAAASPQGVPPSPPMGAPPLVAPPPPMGSPAGQPGAPPAGQQAPPEVPEEKGPGTFEDLHKKCKGPRH